MDRSNLRDLRLDHVFAMTRFYRWAAAFLVVLTLAMLYAPKAHAYPATKDPSVCSVAPCTGWQADGGGPIYPSQSELCSAIASNATASAGPLGGTYSGEPAGPGSCKMTQRLTLGNGDPYEAVSYVGVHQESMPPKPPVYSCPGGGTLSGSTCSCQSPSVENAAHTACEGAEDPMIQLCKDNKVLQDSTFSGTRAEYTEEGWCASKDMCSPMAGAPPGRGCAYSKACVSSQRAPNGDWYSSYQTQFSGSPCNTSSVPSGTGTTSTTPQTGTPTKPTDNPCPKGQIPGTASMNGTTVTICQKAVETSTPPTTSTTKTGSGTGEVTKTETKETKCVGDVCTTTTSTSSTSSTGSGMGTTTSTGSVTQGKGDFCKQNPKNRNCDGEGGSFGGQCSSGFTCDGDAVMCAVALEQHKTNCKLLTPDTDASSEYNKAINKTDGFDLKNMRDNAQQVNVGTFDSNGWGWSRSCPTDPQIVLPWAQNRVLSIPFSRMCDVLGLLSTAAVGLTLLGCLVWVIGGKKT